VTQSSERVCRIGRNVWLRPSKRTDCGGRYRKNSEEKVVEGKGSDHHRQEVERNPSWYDWTSYLLFNRQTRERLRRRP